MPYCFFLTVISDFHLEPLQTNSVAFSERQIQVENLNKYFICETSLLEIQLKQELEVESQDKILTRCFTSFFFFFYTFISHLLPA